VGWYRRVTVALCLRVLITLTFASRDSQPGNLSARYLFKLRFPTLPGLGNEEQDKAVPRLPEFVVGSTLHIGLRVLNALLDF
jgi:hypothetical protein